MDISFIKPILKNWLKTDLKPILKNRLKTDLKPILKNRLKTHSQTNCNKYKHDIQSIKGSLINTSKLFASSHWCGQCLTYHKRCTKCDYRRLHELSFTKTRATNRNINWLIWLWLEHGAIKILLVHYLCLRFPQWNTFQPNHLHSPLTHSTQ